MWNVLISSHLEKHTFLLSFPLALDGRNVSKHLFIVFSFMYLAAEKWKGNFFLMSDGARRTTHSWSINWSTMGSFNTNHVLDVLIYGAAEKNTKLSITRRPGVSHRIVLFLWLRQRRKNKIWRGNEFMQLRLEKFILCWGNNREKIVKQSDMKSNDVKTLNLTRLKCFIELIEGRGL